MKSSTGVAVCCALLCACGQPGLGESVDSEQERIVYGERSVAEDDNVVQVIARSPGTASEACTGTLLAPNIVLTALHCVAHFSGGEFSCSADGTLSSVKPGDGNIGELVAAEEVAIHVGVYPGPVPDAFGAKLFGTGSNQICRNDLALVVLDRDLPASPAAMRLARGVELGELSRVVGYGASEATTTIGRFARAGLRVIDRGQDAGGSSTRTAAPHTVVIGQGPCHGDSGGPLFAQDTGAVIGVYSLVSGASCTALGVRNVYTRLAPFSDLVQSAFDYAAQTPILEPDSGSAGHAGSAGSASGASSVGGQSGGPPRETGGLESGGAGPRQGGSGSRQDASCACRSARTLPHGPAALSALVLASLLPIRRWRRRASRPSGAE